MDYRSVILSQLISVTFRLRLIQAQPHSGKLELKVKGSPGSLVSAKGPVCAVRTLEQEIWGHSLGAVLQMQTADVRIINI